MSSVTMQDDTIILRANVQDFLILTSAGLSFIKSMLSIGTYSYWQILLALMELACTGIALTIYIMNDFVVYNDSSAYGDDKLLFLLAFASSCSAEVMDVIFTFQTVRIYKKLKRDVSHQKMTHEDLEQIKKIAQCRYLRGLLMGAVLMAIVPIIAFWKANFEVDYFAPFGFSPQNGKFLLIAMILGCIVQAIILVVAVLTIWDETVMGIAIGACGLFLQILAIPAAVLVYIVMARVEEGPEAGSLTYLLMISTLQGIEGHGETSRYLTWIEGENGWLPFQLEREQECE